MKKTIVLFAAASILTLQSCDLLNSSEKYDLAQPEKVTELKTEIDKNIKAEDLVHQINFIVSNHDGFSNEPNVVNVTLGKPGEDKKVERVSLVLSPEIKVEREDTEYVGKVHSMPYSEFDLSKVPTYISEAAAMIPAEEYEYAGIGDYRIQAQSEGFLEHHIVLQVTPTTGATQMNGRRIETTYYEIEYKTDKDGKLNMLIEEE
ncbi:hypothetical protein [Paenimyroides aestuarii]|uniref:Lipoprotein n=1 Tax=Paenimyroides aestuarii TaxID=2968490 RepID=A0ABY5NQV9_9FLAO|nr:hypothetical protein [Paenimyroides aestuarii]UUV20869.1 hypothetical protein NPX36_11140 [Paenimyroides aestuarii]